MVQERVVVTSKDGVTIYGKVIDTNGKLGQYEVESIHRQASGFSYHSFAEAEKEYERLLGVKNSKNELRH